MTKAGAPPSAARAPSTSSRQVSPAMTMIARPVSAIRIAVPRSGCLATSRVGAAISTAGIRSFQDRRASLAETP